MGRILILFVRVYQKCISPILPPSCIYEPTCSQYMIDAIRSRGVVRGFLLGAWRILRCHPYARGGYDPVPGTRKDLECAESE